MKKLFLPLFSFLFILYFLIILPAPALALPSYINYQGRAFDANNKYIQKKCWPISIKIGRFLDIVKSPIGTEGGYTQTNPGVEHTLTADKVINTHPSVQCPSGQVYVENGLFNVILNLDTFGATFLGSTLPYYGVSVNFNNAGWSLWQPLVQDNWIYPNTQDKSPQLSYYLSSHNTGSSVTSWGLWTNHGFWANGGLGAPVIWLMGGDFSASVLTMTAGGPGDGWYSSIDASNKAVGTVPEKARPLRINPSGGDTEISSKLRIVSQGSNRANIRPLVQNGDILISDDSGQETRGITIQNGGNLKIGNNLCFGTDCKNAWPAAPQSWTTGVFNGAWTPPSNGCNWASVPNLTLTFSLSSPRTVLVTGVVSTNNSMYYDLSMDGTRLGAQFNTDAGTISMVKTYSLPAGSHTVSVQHQVIDPSPNTPDTNYCNTSPGYNNGPGPRYLEVVAI